MSCSASFRRLVSTLALGIWVLSAPSLADEVRDFDIPAGPAEAAVNQFGNQAYMSVLYEPGSLDNYKTRALKGRYEKLDGLQKLLEGSGLEFGGTSEQLVDVHPCRVRSGRPRCLKPKLRWSIKVCVRDTCATSHTSAKR